MTDDKKLDEVKQQETPSKARSYVLYGIFALMLCALAYDYQVARPAVENAYNTLAEKLVVVNEDPTRSMTDAIVEETLGRKPVRTFNDGIDQVDVFQWQAGLPFRKHSLYVVYNNMGGERCMMRMSNFTYQTNDEIIGDTWTNSIIESSTPLTDEELAAQANAENSEAGERDGRQSNEARGGQGNRGTQGENVEMDTDNDGSVSLDEFVNQIETEPGPAGRKEPADRGATEPTPLARRPLDDAEGTPETDTPEPQDAAASEE